MTIAKFYPYSGSRGRLRLGLNKIDQSEWIQFEEDFSTRIVEKKDLITAHQTRVLNTMPESILAQKEFLKLLTDNLKTYHSERFKFKPKEIISVVDDQQYQTFRFEKCPLELISYLAGDDFCMLEENGEDYVLKAASVCAPTWWDLPEKMGKPLQEIHQPIAGLEEKIGRMIRHFLKNLQVDDYYERSNWFLFTRPDLCIFPFKFDLYEDMSNITLDNIESNLYLRIERQTFKKLAGASYIVFGIKVYVESISVVRKHKEIATDLMQSIQALNEEQRQAFGIPYLEKPLTEYLQAVI